MSAPSKGAYARTGVDLDVNARVKSGIASAVGSTRTSLVAAGFGSFGGAVAIPAGYRDPVLVSSVDGVGTKLKVAFAMKFHQSVGGDLDAGTVLALVQGMAGACRASGVALIGGETAQMPDTYRTGAYDLAGTMIGIVERTALPDPGRVERGDVIVGLPSLGLHTNGYSLARRTAAALGPDHPVGEGTLADALLAPHPSYLAELGIAFADPDVRVAAHITGGGLQENMPRVLPDHLGARFEVGAWPVPPVFGVIAADQDVAPREMYRVFNMGIGMAIVVAIDGVQRLLRALPGAFLAGEVVERGDPAVLLAGL